MKKFIQKIKKRLHNTGSSLILVVVGLAFVGILSGALLTAVAYGYRQKMYDYNAKSNFYYLDQAMDEIYAGVGAKTVNCLTEAYEKTREEIVYFDMASESYKTKPDDEADLIFKNHFMENFAGGADADLWKIVKHDDSDQVAYKKSIVFAMTTMITNSSVKLDDSNMTMKYVYKLADGTIEELNGLSTTYDKAYLTKIVIKNVKLTRTAKYKRNNAGGGADQGQFTQTVSTDIEITRPDFKVSFGSLDTDISTLFDYCMVADSGVDIDRIDGNVLTVSGNIYAASDFYNKDYNAYNGTHPTGYTVNYNRTLADGTTKTYKMDKVSKYIYDATNANNTTLFNNGQVQAGHGTKDLLPYDGKNDRSKYSGLYIDGGRVNIMASTIVVPGSISVMNGGILSVYGKNKEDSDEETFAKSDIWADEVVLGGYSLPGKNEGEQNGARALFNANMYVKDDTQIESDYSRLVVSGGYYGFGNSEARDPRTFIPIVAKTKATDNANIYERELYNESGNYTGKENRGHYNSSSVLINGEHAELDLSNTQYLFIAGRAYIELSKAKTGSAKVNVDKKKGTDSTGADNIEITNKSYQYSADVDDYKTGESLAVKSSQLAYYPNKASGTLEKDPDYNGTTNVKGTFTLTSGATGSALNNMGLFTKYFVKNGKGSIVIPLEIQETTIGSGTDAKTKTYYYIDFVQAAKNLASSNDASIIALLNSSSYAYIGVPTETTITDDEAKLYADRMKQSFIKDYCDYFNFCVDKNTKTKINWLGFEDGYDDAAGCVGMSKLSDTEFRAAYPNTDTYVLENNTSFSRTNIDKKVAELQNVTNLEEFKVKTIKVATTGGTSTNQINTSGVITTTKDFLDFVDSASTGTTKNVTEVQKDNFGSITSTLKGENESKANTNSTSSSTGSYAQNQIHIRDFANDYNKHYNYVKYSLKDLYTSESDAQFIDDLVSTNKESGITPINFYMNFDKLDNLHTVKGGSTNLITSADMGLQDYNIWASDDDVKIEPTRSSGEVTGIIITKGDVYFKNVTKFSGLIICGGKIYVSTSNTTLSSISSTKLCRNMISAVVGKARNFNSTDTDAAKEAKCAVAFLELFKSYEDLAQKAKNGELESDTSRKTITQVDYSDIVRYNNWVKGY